MKEYKLINNIAGWIAFLIAAVTYLLTMEPTASFWDCGEFIATAYKLEVGHPPGAPLFMLLGRFFSLFTSDPESVAMMINALSALASAFTILFLFWTITHLARKMIVKIGEEMDMAKMISVIGAGMVGALAYTFSDTFWFSAVEGEVYALSSLFTAVVFWAILKWENVADEPHADRWIIFIAYLMGLSIGVHLLNLLAIPAIVFVYYFRKYKPDVKGIIITSVLGIVILGLVQYGIVQGLVKVAAQFELIFVNDFGLPFYSGVFGFLILLIASLGFGMYFTQFKNKPILNVIFFSIASILLGIPFFSGSTAVSVIAVLLTIAGAYLLANKQKLLNTILLVFTVILLGYSTFATIVIRSLANPPMDENNPENIFSLLDYLNREQYGDRPLFYGQYYSAAVIGTEEGSPKYYPDPETGKYKLYSHKIEVEYSPELQTIFPRMYDNDPSHIKEYEKWGGVKGRKVMATVVSRDPETGERTLVQKMVVKPTFLENLQYFFKYQVGHMYLRYFMWNFAGRQNDIQGHGGFFNGNWISGIPALDAGRTGPTASMTEEMKNNPGRNVYYLLPLILGLIGFFVHFNLHNKDAVIVSLLFFFTGIAIVIYLNQYPLQPRERDYAFAGSFYAFTIWIGLGIISLFNLARKYISPKTGAIASTVIGLLMAPVIMAVQNWDDHDRSGRYTARDFAKNYLDSCEPNAVIFTNGDNDTFPLWYVQEVEGYRTDVRVINLSLLNTDWYIDQMKRAAYDSEAVPFGLTHDQYRQGGSRDYVYMVGEEAKYLFLDEKYLANPKQKEIYKGIFELMMAVIKSSDIPTAFPKDYAELIKGHENILPSQLADFVKRLTQQENATKYKIDQAQINEVQSMLNQLIESIAGDFLPLDVAMRFVRDDSPQSAIEGQKYIPSRKLCIPVDKEKVLKNGTVSPEYKDKIVDRIEFEIPESGINKNFLMILDLLANNNWDRPVYFAVTIGRENFLYLDEYLQLEGLAYRLVPVKSDLEYKDMRDNTVGFVNTKIMYQNLMENFQWGRMNEPDVYLDEQNIRMLYNLKNKFSRLADELILEDKNDLAVKVLDRCNELIPNERVPYNLYNIAIVKGYYLAGEYEKARKHLKILEENLNQELEYYGTFDSEDFKSIEDRILGAQDILSLANGLWYLLGDKKPEGVKMPAGFKKEDMYKKIMQYYKLSFREKMVFINHLELAAAYREMITGFTEDVRSKLGFGNSELFEWFLNAPEEKLLMLRNTLEKQLDDKNKKEFLEFIDRFVLYNRTKADKEKLAKLDNIALFEWIVSFSDYEMMLTTGFIRADINL